MKKNSFRPFSVLELLIVITIMTILALMIFAIVKGVKDSARTALTESTIKTCKSSMENLYNFAFNEARKNNIEIYQHPLFSKVWPSNKVWTFRDMDLSDLSISSNGLLNMINIGNLGIENRSMLIDEVTYPDANPSKTVNPKKMNTLLDGWGNPILLIRNETPWWVKTKLANEEVVLNVYMDRRKTNVGLYGNHMFKTNSSGKNLYAWNDISFDHIDSNGVNEPSYEIAPGAVGDKVIGALMFGKEAVPYNSNDFDFFSSGKDGKVGNLIPNDMMQDRWDQKVRINLNDVTSPYKFNWIAASASVVDPDSDNIVSFNKYILE